MIEQNTVGSEGENEGSAVEETPSERHGAIDVQSNKYLSQVSFITVVLLHGYEMSANWVCARRDQQRLFWQRD